MRWNLRRPVSLVLTLAVLGGIVLGPGLASAQMACTDREAVLKHLSSKYSEAPVGMGVSSNGGVIELLSSQKGGSWTLIMTLPTGHSCMLAAGDSWHQVAKPESTDPDA